MPSISEAVDSLRSALSKRSVESHVRDAFEHIASYLVLLNSSIPSVQMVQKLCTVLRQPLLSLYDVCLQATLQLSSSILSTVLGKLCDSCNSEDENFGSAWGGVAQVILSGVLDFLDQKDGANIGPDGAVWEVFCRIVCEFFFLDSGRELPKLSTPLYLSAYNVLTEIATRHMTVRNALRNRVFLGGERLGAAISRTRDYLLLEALLILFARLLPPILNTSQGKSRRIKFVKEVLGSPKLFKRSAELLDTMQNASSTHWDDVSARIIDVLAGSDITYPQPFSIDEISVCGYVYPQPLSTDRLIMDKQAFLANIVEENDTCESLQVPYSDIRTITLDTSEKNVPKGKVLIMVYLTSPPSVGNVEMKPPNRNLLHAKFVLQSDVIGRFMEALRRRGVGKLSFISSLAKVPKRRKSVSIGSALKFMDNSSPVPLSASFEGKVQHVNQVYRTDVEEPEIIPGPYIGDENVLHAAELKPVPKDETLVPEALESAVVEDAPRGMKDARVVPPPEGTSRVFSNSTSLFSTEYSVGATPLLGDKDELSEISEFEPDNNPVHERVNTGLSPSRQRGSGPGQHKTDHTWMNRSSGVAATMKIKNSSVSVLDTGGRCEEVAQWPPKTANPLLEPISPMSSLSSGTQVDVSLKPLSNCDTAFTTGTEVIGDLPITRVDFVEALDKSVDDYGASNGEFIIAPTGTSQTVFSFTENEPEEHARSFTLTSGANHCRETTKNTGILSRTAGNRRKRKTIESPGSATVEVEDDSTHPRKKSRNGMLWTRENWANSKKTLPDSISISGVERCVPKTIKGSSPSTNPTMVDYDVLPELKPAYQGARRSSRLKKRQTKTAGTRANATRNKAHRRNRVDDQSGTERKRLTTHSLPDHSRETPLISVPNFVATPIGEVSSSKFNHDSIAMLRDSENIASLPQETPKVASIRCEPSQPDVTPSKEQRRDFDAAQPTASDVVQSLDEFNSKIENNQLLSSDLRTTNDDAISPKRVFVYPFSQKESEDLAKFSSSIVESTPPKKIVTTIDLTDDNSPARRKSKVHKASVAPLHPERRIQSPKFGTFGQTDCITTGEHANCKPARHERRSVTFASPIESVPDQNVQSNCPSPSPYESESNILSPLRVFERPQLRGESPDWTAPRAALQKSKMLHFQAPPDDQTTDGVEIQEIVEVLNDIQAVIVKGITNRFRNVKKYVQHGREELVRQVLDELEGMVSENARYFNGLVRLEEEYYKNGKAITRCWEELIDCNDSIAVQFRKALTDHDQNISAKTLPKSLLPLKPASLCRQRSK